MFVAQECVGLGCLLSHQLGCSLGHDHILQILDKPYGSIQMAQLLLNGVNHYGG